MPALPRGPDAGPAAAAPAEPLAECVFVLALLTQDVQSLGPAVAWTAARRGLTVYEMQLIPADQDLTVVWRTGHLYDG